MISSPATRHSLSLRTRLTLLASGTMALFSIAISVLALIAVRGLAEEHRQDRASAAALRVVRPVVQNRLPPVLPDLGVTGVQVVDPRGRVAASTRNWQGLPRIAAFVPEDDLTHTSRTVCASPAGNECLITMAHKVYLENGDWVVYAAEPAVPWYVSGDFLSFQVCAIGLIVILTAYATSRTISRTLAPVTAIRTQLAEITATDPGRRLPLPKHDDELRHLAETANATLDRLESSMERLRRFSSDASHDLRSPMTAMRAQIEEALLHPDDTDWPQIADSVLDSIDHLEAIVTDLLTLARLDAGVHRGSDEVDLGRLVTAELGRRVPRRPVQVITHLDRDVVVTGDRLRLARLLTNLVDNAERHAESKVVITVRAEPDAVVLDVQDDGQGVAPKDREAVFQRFVRLDASRRRDPGGTGLGLPIARQIAETHGGTLTIEDSPRGALFRLRIPAHD